MSIIKSKTYGVHKRENVRFCFISVELRHVTVSHYRYFDCRRRRSVMITLTIRFRSGSCQTEHTFACQHTYTFIVVSNLLYDYSSRVGLLVNSPYLPQTLLVTSSDIHIRLGVKTLNCVPRIAVLSYVQCQSSTSRHNQAG